MTLVKTVATARSAWLYVAQGDLSHSWASGLGSGDLVHMGNLGKPTHKVIWIGEGADVPDWLERLLPLPIQTFVGQWGATRQEDGSLIGYWSDEKDKFLVVGPRTTWTIGQNSNGGVIYWGHGTHNLGELLVGSILGINWLRQLIITQQIDGSSPCSIEKAD